MHRSCPVLLGSSTASRRCATNAAASLTTARCAISCPTVEKPSGHAFISYVREDAHHVDKLQQTLEAADVRVWRDTEDLWPGQDWRKMIRRAITDDALVFIACFSSQNLAKEKSYQNEELALAIEQLRLRKPDDPWLIPVRFDECKVPDLDIGGGRTLASIQRADLFGDRYEEQMKRLVTSVQRLLGQHPPGQDAKEKTNPRPQPTTTRPGRQNARRGDEDAPQPVAPATHIPPVPGYNPPLAPSIHDHTSDAAPQGSVSGGIDLPSKREYGQLEPPSGPRERLTQREGVPHDDAPEVLAPWHCPATWPPS